MVAKIKVLYLVNIPSPYRVAFFNELGKLCDLTVLFEREASEERELSWHEYKFESFQAKFLKGIKYKSNTALSFEVIKYLSNNIFDVVVVGGYATPTGALAISYLKLRKIPFVLNIDGGLINEHEIRIKYKIKRYFISSASFWLSTGSASSDYLRYYGANDKNIYVYPFTSLFQKDIEKNVIEDVDKENLRNKLGIRENNVLLTVGRFINIKGFDVLLRACASLHKSTGIYFIGGEPTEEYLEIKDSLGLSNVHFIGFKSKENLAEYYKASDVFILPTRGDVWGLVINEAMAYGLPVITTNKCVAGLELVEDYENGFIVPVDNQEVLAERIDELIVNRDLIKKMARNNLHKISDYTIENMAYKTALILQNIQKKWNVNNE